MARGDYDEAAVEMERLAATWRQIANGVRARFPRSGSVSLLAQARGDEEAYRELRDRYRAMANDLGFEGHMAWAAEMP